MATYSMQKFRCETYTSERRQVRRCPPARNTQRRVARSSQSRGGTHQSCMRTGGSDYNFVRGRLDTRLNGDVPPLRPGNFTSPLAARTKSMSDLPFARATENGGVTKISSSLGSSCLIYDVQALGLTAGLRKKHVHSTLIASSCSEHSKSHVHAARYRLQAQGSVGVWEP